MELRRLGQTAIEVSRVALGCGNFGGVGSAPQFFGAGESEEEAFALMDAAWALGIRLFDTADAYGGGRSERWIGAWIRARGVRPVVTTKVFHSVVGDPRDRGLAPERVRRRLAESLDRLGLEGVDLYLTHEPDPDTPLRVTLEVLAELAAEGRVRAFGLSNVGAAELDEALALAPVACVQNSYSLLDREVEDELLPLCEHRGVAFTAYGPLAGGWLTGKYRRGAAPPPSSRMALRPQPYEHLREERVYRGLAALAEHAARRGVDTATLALAWLLGEPRVTSVILGPRRPAHLESARAALELHLSPDERAELRAVFD